MTPVPAGTAGNLDALLAEAEDILSDPLNHRFNPLLLLQILTQLAYEYRTHTHATHPAQGGYTGRPEHPFNHSPPVEDP